MTPLVPNPLNQIARIGVGLLAIYLGIQASMQVAHTVNSVWQTTRALDSKDLEIALEFGAVSLGTALLLSALPAWILFRSRHVVAEWLAPMNDSSPPLSISGADALCVGYMLLAVSLAVDGSVGVVSALTLAGVLASTGAHSSSETASGLLSQAAQLGVAALLQVISAAVLWRYARRLSATGAR